MEKVEPIRDKELLKEIISYLENKENNGERDALLFSMGVFLGLRINELIKIQVYQVKNKETFRYKTTKNSKTIEVPIPPKLRKRIKEYTKGKEPQEYLFRTRQSDHMTRQNATRIMKEIAEEFCLENFNTHSLRKTCALFLYEQSGHNIALVQMVLGHDSAATTVAYLGITTEYIKDNMGHFDPFR